LSYRRALSFAYCTEAARFAANGVSRLSRDCEEGRRARRILRVQFGATSGRPHP